MVDADIIGVTELDSVQGKSYECVPKFMNMMKELGYGVEYFEKNNGLSANAIFYKKSMFICMESHAVFFATDSS